MVFLHLYLIYLKWPTVFGGLQLDKQKCEEYMTKSRLKDLFPLHSTSMWALLAVSVDFWRPGKTVPPVQAVVIDQLFCGGHLLTLPLIWPLVLLLPPASYPYIGSISCYHYFNLSCCSWKLSAGLEIIDPLCNTAQPGQLDCSGGTSFSMEAVFLEHCIVY